MGPHTRWVDSVLLVHHGPCNGEPVTLTEKPLPPVGPASQWLLQPWALCVPHRSPHSCPRRCRQTFLSTQWPPRILLATSFLKSNLSLEGKENLSISEGEKVKMRASWWQRTRPRHAQLGAMANASRPGEGTGRLYAAHERGWLSH